MSKVDLSSAYRSIPIGSKFWKRQGFMWDGQTYMDLRLPFGNRAAPGIFHRLTMAVVRWMKSQGFPGVVGYLDDFLIVARTKQECERGFLLIIAFLRFLGMLVNEVKCEEPTQLITFLGIELETASKQGECTAKLSNDRLNRVVKSCQEVASRRVTDRKKLESLMGLLVFCCQVVFGASVYLRTGFATVNSSRRKIVVVSRSLSQDMSWLVRLMTVHNGTAVCISRREVHPGYWSVDASTSTGMGGFFEEQYFGLTWDDVAGFQQKHYFPFKCKATSHINYLELFAVYWSLKLWGDSMRGMTFVLNTDSQAVRGMITKLWGDGVFIPLLKQILLLCTHYDVRFKAIWLSSKANILSDTLSRQDWVGYRRALQEWSDDRLRNRDDDDWQFAPLEVLSLDNEFGPFEIDACCDDSEANAHFFECWTKSLNCLRQDWDALNVYCNPPFSDILRILLRFLHCKCRTPRGTSAVFVLPFWDTEPFWWLVQAMPRTFVEVRDFPRDSNLFTAPIKGRAGRNFCGNTKWGVKVIRVGPEPLTESVDWVRWGRFVDVSTCRQ